MSTHESAHLAFTVPQPELLFALKFAEKGIARRPKVPVLGGVLLTGDGTTVTVEGFDYEQARRVTLRGATCASAGSVLVSVARLREMVAALPKTAPVTLTGEGVNLRLTNGKTSYTLPTMPVEDYPSRPGMPATVGMVDGSVLAAQVAQVAKFAGRDETLPMMTGLRMESEGGRLSLLATDRYRLAVRDLDWAHEVDAFAALVPAKDFAEVLATIAKDGAGVVTIGHDGEGLLGIETDHVRVTTRLLDGANYPPIRSLIPSTLVRELDVDAAELVETVKRVAVALTKTQPVLLRLGEGTLTVQGGDDLDGGASEPFEGATFIGTDDASRAAARKAVVANAAQQARKQAGRDPKELRDERVAAAVKAAEEAFDRSGEMLIGFNPAYLCDVLTTTGTKRVRLGVLDPWKPVTVVPLDAAGDPLPGVTNLIMTIRVTQDVPEPAKATDAPTAEPDPEPTPEPTPGPAADPDPDPEPEPERAAEMQAAVAAATPEPGEVVYDRTVPHPFAKAVDDGKKPNAVSRCRCGTTFMAKVHRGQGAAVKAATPAPAKPVVPSGPVWIAVLQLASRIAGQMVTEATEAAARSAIAQFGNDKVLDVAGRAGTNVKRMYVATGSQQDAELMQRTAAAFGIPAHTVQGDWPPQHAAADNTTTQEDTQVKAHEESPIITDAEQPFDAARTAKEAYVLFGTGDYDGALAIITDGLRRAPEHRFNDGKGGTYGWERIRDGILAKQASAQATADAERDAMAELRAQATEQAAEPEPETDTEPEPEPEPEPEQADDEHPMARQLRAALAGHPADVIEAAVAAALASVTAGPAPKPQAAAKPEPKPEPKRQPVAAAARPSVPAARKPVAPAAPAFTAPAVTPDEVARWKTFGMTPPVVLSGERVYVLPAGTRLRALRRAVLDTLGEAKRDGILDLLPVVDADKSTRPYRLRVRFTEPGALTAATDLVDDAVEAALPEVLPARVAA